MTKSVRRRAGLSHFEHRMESYRTHATAVAPAPAATPSTGQSSSPAPQSASKARKERYLGLLFPTESFRVYGYATVSLVKLILVLNDLSNAKDQEIRNVRPFQVVLQSFHPYSCSNTDLTANERRKVLHKISRTLLRCCLQSLLRGGRTTFKQGI